MSFQGLLSSILGQQNSGFSISEFRSVALRNGILKPNLYLVNFQQAPFPNNLMFFTEAIDIPAIDMDTQMVRRYGYGPIEFVPFRPVFSPVQITFICEATQRNVLTTMLNSISSIVAFSNYDDITSPGMTVYGGSTVATPYEVAYKSDYEFDLQVFAYNEQQDTINIWNFRDCYAKEIGPISLGWNNNDQYVKATVTFMYTDFGINRQLLSQGDGIASISGLQSILGIGSPSQVFNANPVPLNVLSALTSSNLANFL